MKPLFTKLDELKPPKWSVFHKEGTVRPDSSGIPVTKEEEKEVEIEEIEEEKEAREDGLNDGKSMSFGPIKKRILKIVP